MSTKTPAIITAIDETELETVVGGYAQTVGDILNGMPWPPPSFPFPNPSDPDVGIL